MPFVLHTCPLCGAPYAPGSEQDPCANCRYLESTGRNKTAVPADEIPRSCPGCAGCRGRADEMASAVQGVVCAECGAPAPVDRVEGTACLHCGGRLVRTNVVRAFEAHRDDAHEADARAREAWVGGHSVKFAIGWRLTFGTVAATLAWVGAMALLGSLGWPGPVVFVLALGAVFAAWAGLAYWSKTAAARAAKVEPTVLGTDAGDARCVECGAAIALVVGEAPVCAHCAKQSFGSTSALQESMHRVSSTAERFRSEQESTSRRVDHLSERRWSRAFMILAVAYLTVVFVATIVSAYLHG